MSLRINPTHNGFGRFVGFVSGNIDFISHYDWMNTFDWWHVSNSGVRSYAMRDGIRKLVVEPEGKPRLFRLDTDLKEADE